MGVVHRKHDLLEEPARVILRQPPRLGDILEQIPARRQVQHQHQVIVREEHLQWVKHNLFCFDRKQRQHE
jgi:hypothetical protein